MDQQIVNPEIKEIAPECTGTSLPSKAVCVMQQHWKLLIALIVGLSVLCAFVFIAFMIYTKYFGKGMTSKKKKSKCDHVDSSNPRTDSASQHGTSTSQQGGSTGRHGESPDVRKLNVASDIGKLDSIIKDIDDEDQRDEEEQDRERVVNSKLHTKDVTHVEEATSYED